MLPQKVRGETPSVPLDQTSLLFSVERLAFIPADKPKIERVETSPYLEQQAQKAAETRKRVLAQNRPRVEAAKMPRAYGNPCSCVMFAKAYSGKNPGPVGYARNWPVNLLTPVVGAVGKTNESKAGHVFVVTAVTSTTITVIEGNLSRCRVTTRTIPINSPIIRGYYF